MTEHNQSLTARKRAYREIADSPAAKEKSILGFASKGSVLKNVIARHSLGITPICTV